MRPSSSTLHPPARGSINQILPNGSVKGKLFFSFAALHFLSLRVNELNVSRYKGAQAWNRSCSVVNRRKTELSFAHARFLLRHYAHARTDRAGIPDRVPTGVPKGGGRAKMFLIGKTKVRGRAKMFCETKGWGQCCQIGRVAAQLAFF